MNMNRAIGLALLAISVLMLFLGYQSSQGLDDQASEALTGEYTESTVWYWIIAAASGAGGAFMLVLRGR